MSQKHKNKIQKINCIHLRKPLQHFAKAEVSVISLPNSLAIVIQTTNSFKITLHNNCNESDTHTHAITQKPSVLAISHDDVVRTERNERCVQWIRKLLKTTNMENEVIFYARMYSLPWRDVFVFPHFFFFFLSQQFLSIVSYYYFMLFSNK